MKRSVWLWRWRRNPLRRRSYAAEAWIVLAVGLVMAVAAPVAAIAASRNMHDVLIQQRRDRHSAVAVLTQDASAADVYDARAWVPARWTAPDGTPRTGRTRVDAGLKRGARVAVWTDDRGALTTTPPSAQAVRANTAMVGLMTGAGVCLVLAACYRFAAGSLNRRRVAQWDVEWARVGPQWAAGTPGRPSE